MRPLLHVVSFLLMLPGLIFAAGFLLLGHAIAGGTLLEFFSRLLFHASWLVGGGLLVLGALLCAVLIGGLVARTRFLAASCVALLSITSAVALIALGTGGSLVLLPGLAALSASGWLAMKEGPRAAPVDAAR